MKTGESPDLLLVEDSPDDVELMLRAIHSARLAHSVRVARDGVEAIDFLLGEGAPARPALPQVVLLDLELPGLSGLEVLARIRGDERTRTLPVVVVTSSTEEDDIRTAYALGANSYVVKPLESGRFAAAVGEVGRYWLGRNQPPA